MTKKWRLEVVGQVPIIFIVVPPGGAERWIFSIDCKARVPTLALISHRALTRMPEFKGSCINGPGFFPSFRDVQSTSSRLSQASSTTRCRILIGEAAEWLAVRNYLRHLLLLLLILLRLRQRIVDF